MNAPDDWSTNLRYLTERFTGGQTADITGDAPETSLLSQVARALDENLTWPNIWLLWSTLRGELPTDADLVEFRRDARLNGSARAISALGDRRDLTVFGYSSAVQIVSGAVIVDVNDTCQTDKITGIQRVVRETVARWARDHAIELVAWTHDYHALRRLTRPEAARIRGADDAATHGLSTPDDGSDPEEARPNAIVIPDGGTLIVPEMFADPARAERLLALARYSNVTSGYIGYDCVPITSGETAADGIAANFPLYLDAISYSAAVATISDSTAHEFEAWKQMLPASGRTGPGITPVFLGGDSLEPTEAELSEARQTLKLDDTPMVLVVGSHEPRKNHLSVLQAARALWRRGDRFSLVMIGGKSWNSGPFDAMAQALRDTGYPLTIVKSATDALLSSSYRLASVSIFTSLHEGFGLPIVESLRSGTPVIASAVGSMGEIAARYAGVIEVDPYSDSALAEALHSALTDPAVLHQKREALAANEYVTWDEYAARTWSVLTATA